MADIRPIDQIAGKWATVTPQRSSDYEFGIKNPRADWQAKTASSADSWKVGVTNAANNDLFRKGVVRAGTDTWQRGALEKGTQRWGPGVALAEDKYAAGFAPFREAIARVQLPPRFARRDPRNLDRVKAVVDALVKAKAAQT